MCQMHHLGNRKRMGQRLGQAQRLVLRWVRYAPVLQSTTAREQRTENREQSSTGTRSRHELLCWQ